MNQQNHEVNNLPKKHKKPNNWNSLWIFIIVLLALVGGIIILYVSNTKLDIDETNYPTVGTNYNSRADGLPKEVYAYNGKVIVVKNNILQIAISKNDNYTLTDKKLTVKVDQNTKYRKFIVPANILKLKAGDSGDYYKRSNVTLNTIKVNDQVTIIADENVKNKTEFTAAVVEIHEKSNF